MTPDRVLFHSSLDEAITFQLEQRILGNLCITGLVAQFGYGGVPVDKNEDHPDVSLDDPRSLQHGFLAGSSPCENQMRVYQIRVHFFSRGRGVKEWWSSVLGKIELCSLLRSGESQ